MTQAWIGIGSNVGERRAFCRRAVDELKNSGTTEVEAVSSLYETTPVGGPPQRSFVNLVARISTDLSARDLLTLCKDIESRIGREDDAIRWGPRVIDLDILLYGSMTVNESDLQVPHPRLTERRFALVPLLELDPRLTLPSGEALADHADTAEGDVIPLEGF